MDSYRPASPDLSGFVASPSKPPPLSSGYRPSSPDLSSFQPKSPDLPAFHQAPPSYNPGGEYLGRGSEYLSGYLKQEDDIAGGGYMPPIPALPSSHSFVPSTFQNSYQPYNTTSYTQPPYLPSNTKHEQTYDGAFDGRMASRKRVKKEEEDDEDYGTDMRSSKGTGGKLAGGGTQANPTNIQIKTKFPVARIKRIMQADDDVGKVAQVTPVAVNKALELFMIALVTGAATKARDSGGKRVSAQHLKSVVEGEDKWDFLGEIVGRVPEEVKAESGKGRKKKESSDSDSEAERKPKKGKGRRKKSDD